MKFYNKQPLSFIIRFLLLFLAWKGSFFIIWRSEQLLSAYNRFSISVIQIILKCTAFFLETLNYPIQIITETRVVKIIGTSGVTVGEPCIGFGLMALICGLVISTNLKVSKKIKYISIGLIMVNALNILRISALAILVQYDPYLWELNHKFIFTIVVYSIIFLLWITVNRSPKPQKARPSN